MHLGGAIQHQALTLLRCEPLPTNVPRRFRFAGDDEGDDVGHVAAADEDAIPLSRQAHELRKPANYFVLDLGGDGRQRPRAAIWIHRRGEEIGERANRRSRRRDVAPEARAAIVCRLLEERLAEFLQHRCDVGPLLGHFQASQFLAQCIGQQRRRRRCRRQVRVEVGDRIDQRVSDLPKLVGRHVGRRDTTGRRLRGRRGFGRFARRFFANDGV